MDTLSQKKLSTASVENEKITSNRTESSKRINQLVVMAMFSALAYVVTFACKAIPITVAGILQFDAKDVLIAIVGFIYGPFSSLIVSVIVALMEMFTYSQTGIIGFLMNVISTAMFACVAAFIYKKIHTMKGAVLGLVLGCLAMTVSMLIWNYIVDPLFYSMPRAAVFSMLWSIFLPFNLIKSAINTALCLILYKPVVTALRKAKIVECYDKSKCDTPRISMGLIIIIAFLLFTGIFGLLAMAGIL